VPWAQVLPPGAAVHFRVTSKKSKLYHEDAIAERLERAAVLAIRGSEAIRSATSAEILEDDVREVPRVQRIVVRVFRDEVTLSADASGALLHRRGWRLETAKAPLRETLAAALLLGVGYDGSVPLTDPLSGSGTIPIEAALIARRIAPGKLRRFAAEAWPIVGAAPFAAARLRAEARELPKSPVAIEGHDRDAGAILAAINNARRAGVLQDVSFTRAALSHLTPRAGPGWIVTNPPWGVRIGERKQLRDLYAAIGNAVHAARPDWRVALLTTERMLAAQTGLELVERWKSSSGGVNVRCFASEI
jgi:putative N6-adenine-specific DNA methylase